MRDLYVNGTSIASGWGNEFTRNPDPNNYSWVNYFANSLNSQNVWNHSLVSKPIKITIEHTIGFCEQYYAKYKSYDNLFAMIELLLPQNTKWPTVRFKNTAITDQLITPIVVQANDKGVANSDDVTTWKTMFVRQDKNIDYLKPILNFRIINHNEVNDLDYEIHSRNIQKFYTSKNIIPNRLLEVQKELSYLQDWLISRQIPFLMFWGCGTGKEFHKMVDRTTVSINKYNRLIPMQEFTCFSKAIEWSLAHDDYHPDQLGHKRIADFLFNYATKNELFTPQAL